LPVAGELEDLEKSEIPELYREIDELVMPETEDLEIKQL
jgi:hypothetical protein